MKLYNSGPSVQLVGRLSIEVTEYRFPIGVKFTSFINQCQVHGPGDKQGFPFTPCSNHDPCVVSLAWSLLVKCLKCLELKSELPSVLWRSLSLPVVGGGAGSEQSTPLIRKTSSVSSISDAVDDPLVRPAKIMKRESSSSTPSPYLALNPNDSWHTLPWANIHSLLAIVAFIESGVSIDHTKPLHIQPIPIVSPRPSSLQAKAMLQHGIRALSWKCDVALYPSVLINRRWQEGGTQFGSLPVCAATPELSALLCIIVSSLLSS